MKNETKLKHIVREEVKRLIEQDKYEYVSVDENAEPQPEVKEAVKRFRNMDPEERDTNILLYWLLGSGTPPYKMSQEDAQYSRNAGNQKQACLNCEFFYQKVPTGSYVCSQIRGNVHPEGWCNQWQLASNLKENEDE